MSVSRGPCIAFPCAFLTRPGVSGNPFQVRARWRRRRSHPLEMEVLIATSLAKSSDGQSAHGRESAGEEHDGESGEDAGESRGTEGNKKVADVVPGMTPRCRQRSDEQDSDLTGNEGNEADKAPAAVDKAEPHPIDEEQREHDERRRPGEIPRSVEDIRHTKEAHGHSPTPGGALDYLADDNNHSDRCRKGDGEQRSSEVVRAATDPEGESKGQRPSNALDAKDECDAEDRGQPTDVAMRTMASW